MSLLTELSPDEKIHFSEEFLSRFLSPGFGTMPKREIEILIFHLLLHKTNVFKGKSNYEISNELKISESKVKSYKIEASLKYQQMVHQDALVEIAGLFFEYNKSKPSLEGDTIVFALEDPVLKREFEHAVKELGYFVDYSFHREIIKVKAPIFLEIFVQNFEGGKEIFFEWVKDQYKDDIQFQKDLNKQLPLGKRIEMFLTNHNDEIGVVVSIVSQIIQRI